MFIFINLGGGRNQWQAAAWAIVLTLLLNSGIVNDLLFYTISLVAGGNGRQREEGSVEFSFQSFYAAVIVTGILGVLLYRFFMMVRSHGFWEGLNQMFSINDPFAAGRNPNNQSQRSHLEKISNIVQKLPTDTFVPEEELSKLPISKLKEKLMRYKLDLKGLSEKRDLVDALKKTTFVCNTTCSICCEDYAADDILRVLPCNHTFHLECIDRWFLASTDYNRPAACPYCNHDITTTST